MTYLTLETNRKGYAPDQCGKTMTVQELIDCLSGFDPESKVYFSNDNGYTYGSISEWDFNENYEEDEDDVEED